MKTTNEFATGRILLLRCNEALDGSGLTPEQITDLTKTNGIRYLLVDTTEARYADSGGLRWLLRLRQAVASAGKRLRIVARPGSKVWRNIQLLETDLEVYPSLARAWKDPWEGETIPHPRRTAARA